ncbi:MAG TPA: glycosyltransferase [Candidatus Binatia bacterium]|nr:glycosyltransferase [Candidatus Binatia bacterium]
MLSKLHFVTNGVFTTSIAGGDIHFLKLAEGAAKAGYELNFFGGHALSEVIEKHQVPGAVTLTDNAKLPTVNPETLGGQFAMFRDFYARYRRTLAQLRRIQPEDLAYAVSDYWFDVLPVLHSSARRKLMVLHMEAPTLGQIITRSRPDVDPRRLASLHYWASQEYSLRQFCACARPARWKPEPQIRRHLLYLHPLMARRLKKLGVRDEEMSLLSYGLEVGPTEAVPEQQRKYDAVWIGRVHRQKGLEDLLASLQYLGQRLPDFRAIIIGNVRDALLPEIERRGLTRQVEFSGFVREEEKIRLFKSSRCFLMPSKHEGSPRVIGESVIAVTPVVAYELPNYRPLFGDFVRYVPPFDLVAFQQTAEREIQRMRSGENYLQKMDLAGFKRENSWETTQQKFLAALACLGSGLDHG